jgi:poly(A) polymerase/tRNA nucleotidyltransferase (CCA-adding enzyme)
MSSAVLARLRFSTAEIRLLTKIVANHMRPGWLLKSREVTRKAIYRFFRDTADAGVDVVILALADQLATRGRTLEMEHWRDYLRLAQLLFEHYFCRPAELVNPPHLVSGEDVKALLGLVAGPEVGRLLEAVREAQADGMVRTREEAFRFLRGAALQSPAGADRDSPPL